MILKIQSRLIIKDANQNHNKLSPHTCQNGCHQKIYSETWVLALGWEDPLEEGMAPTPVLLPEESPRTEELGGLQSMGSQRVRQD